MTTDGITYYPLTNGQKMQVMALVSATDKKAANRFNTLLFSFSVKDSNDTESLERAYNAVLEINDALRLRILRRGLALRQYIKPHRHRTLPVETYESATASRDAFLAFAARTSRSLFDEELITATIARYPEGMTLYIQAHHICVDGFSISLIFKQLHGFYKAYANKAEPPKFRAGSIVNFFKDEQAYAKSEQMKADKKYIYDKFMHQKNFSMPAGYGGALADANHMPIQVGQACHDRLEKICSEEGVSIQLLFLCISALTTYRLTGKKTFAISSLSHGRYNFMLKNTVGCVMNTIPIFFTINSALTVREMLKQQYQAYLIALSHGRTPFYSQLFASYKEAFKNGMNFNQSWLQFSAMDYVNAVTDEDCSVEVLSLSQIPYQFYLSMFDFKNSRTEFILNYQKKKFGDKIDRIVDTFLEITNQVSNNLDMTISSIR